MFKENSIVYSVVGSLGVHLLFTLGAGSFLLNINNSITSQKTYKLEFVKRKAPPPVKKEVIQKEPVRQEIKVASLQPKAVPVMQPKTIVRQTNVVRSVVSVPKSVAMRVQRQKAPVMQSAVIHNSRTTMTRRATNIPKARSFTPAKTTSGKGSTRMAMVQGASHFIPRSLPERITPSGSSSPSRSTQGRVTPIQTGVKLASLSLPNAREVPNIVDRGALKGYIGRIQRSIEGAKRYPEASRKAGREGKVKIQFTILRNGEVDDIKLLTRTPYENLNQEAMAAVQRAAPFSGFPDGMLEESLRVILPFRFELN